MEKAFVYGMSVEGDNFTDRVKETKRLRMDFENGINVILHREYQEVLVRLTPKIAFTPEPMSEFSLSLGITP